MIRLRSAGLLAASTVLTAWLGQAQAVEKVPIGDARLRDSQASTTEPNISGVWQVRRAGLRIFPESGGDPPWKPWAEKVFRDRAEDEKKGVTNWDPTGACYGSGTPRILTVGYLTEIIQTKDAIVWTFESQHVYRIIHMNKKMPANPGHSIRGYSVGHWEGDTLVVETAGLSSVGQIDERGTMMTDNTTVLERIRRVGDTLEDTITITDPTAYNAPWTAKRTFYYTDQRPLEYVCEENNRNTPGEDGKFVTHIVK